MLNAPHYFFCRKGRLRRLKENLKPLTRRIFEEHRTSNLTQNSNSPRSQEDHVTEVSEAIDSRARTTLSQKFGSTESRVLGALSWIDIFLLNPLIQGHSGTALQISRNAYGTRQGANEEDCQKDRHSEGSVFQSQTARHSVPEVGYDRYSIGGPMKMVSQIYICAFWKMSRSF